MKTKLAHLRLPALVVIVLVIMDQVSKLLILRLIPLGNRVLIIPHCFALTHLQNPGAAFGLLSYVDFPGKRYFFIIVTIIAVSFMIFFLYRARNRSTLLGIGLTLVTSGAIGNLIDRVCREGVIDFLDVYYGQYQWPTFNLADSVISIGIVALIIDMFVTKPADHASTERESDRDAA